MSAEDTDVFDDLATFSDLTTADIDLEAETSSRLKRSARWIKVLEAGSGNLAVQMATEAPDAVGDNFRQITDMTVGEEQLGKFRKIFKTAAGPPAKTTDVTKIRVGW